MSSTRNRRGKGGRTLGAREIKQAICGHEALAPAGPSLQATPGGVWLTRVTCPACGASEVRETPDSAVFTPVAPGSDPARTPTTARI